MVIDVEKELAALKRLTRRELRQRYAEVFGEPPYISGNRAYLIKKILWRMQALAEGDLSQRARQRAADIANDADLRILPPRSAVRGNPSAQTEQQPAPADERLPAPGSVLTRRYKGQNLHVKILAHGFEFQGETFTSLSALAKKITGTHCSGLRFFGIHQKGGQA